MRDEVSSLFREVADLAPAERTRFFEQQRVPPDLRAEVESLLAFDTPDGAKAAEVAFTIEEDYQGNGLATRLLETMIEIARRHRIVRFEADVLADNAAMLAVFNRCGLPMRKRRDGGVTHIEMDLAAPAVPDCQ